MKLSELKNLLNSLETVSFQLPNKSFVPSHFHVTEVGETAKIFIDCGGTIREEKHVNFQLWQAGDFDHKLAPSKLLKIIDESERSLGISDNEIEVEFQQETIGRFGLTFNGKNFELTAKNTACLADDHCGISSEKMKLQLADLNSNASCCGPISSCC
jgi:hypothetical protein